MATNKTCDSYCEQPCLEVVYQQKITNALWPNTEYLKLAFPDWIKRAHTMQKGIFGDNSAINTCFQNNFLGQAIGANDPTNLIPNPGQNQTLADPAAKL